MTETTRTEMLRQVLAANPDDPFARYGLAMEHSTAGDTEAALAEFAELLRRHPDYTAGYFMAAQALARAGRNQETRDQLARGIASAQRTGNEHARAEMQEMLEELDD